MEMNRKAAADSVASIEFASFQEGEEKDSWLKLSTYIQYFKEADFHSDYNFAYCIFSELIFLARSTPIQPFGDLKSARGNPLSFFLNRRNCTSRQTQHPLNFARNQFAATSGLREQETNGSGIRCIHAMPKEDAHVFRDR